MVSIVCCFIHREVRIECLLFACELLKKIRCLQSLSCIDSDYIRQLRYIYNENRAGSIAPRAPLNIPRPESIEPNSQPKSKSKLKSMCSCAGSRRQSADSANGIVNNQSTLIPLPNGLSKTRTYSNNDSIVDVNMTSAKRRSSASMSLMSSGPTRFQQFFGCLFSNKRNDFHQNNGARKTFLSTSSGEVRRATKDSIKPSISEEPGENRPVSSVKNPLVKLFRFEERNVSHSLSTSSNNKKKVRLLLNNAEPSHLNSHQELASSEHVEQTDIRNQEETRNQVTSGKDLVANKSQANSDLSSIDCPLNNTTTESTNWTGTNLTSSSDNTQNVPITCSRCQKRRVSSISTSFYNSEGPAQADEDSPSKLCNCRLDLLLSETSQIVPSLPVTQRETCNVQDAASQEEQPLLSSQHSSLESDRS